MRSITADGLQRKAFFSGMLFIVLIVTGCTVKSFDGSVVYNFRQVQGKKAKPVRVIEKLTLPQKPDSGEPVLYAGLRRSPYGLPTKNGVDGFWVDKTKKYSETISKISGVWAQPVIIEIVSGYNDDGTTEVWFNYPKKYRGTTEYMNFSTEQEIDHERALSRYDRSGIKAIIQFEPGNADVVKLIDLANGAFGHHDCIIGYGIDAEWYKANSAKAGEVISDQEAKQWLDKVLSINPKYTLFLKHWEPQHLPPNFRHPNLWFLSDSQDYQKMQDLMDNFTFWDTSFAGQTVGYQIGYESDRRWWDKLDDPIVDFSKNVFTTIPRSKYIFWVDFTADDVEF
jgi:hypothetical protein